MMNEREKIIHLWFRNEGCTGGRRYGMAKVIKENLDGFYTVSYTHLTLPTIA